MRTLAALTLAALLSPAAAAGFRTTLSRVHQEDVRARSGAPVIAVRVVADDPGVAGSLDRELSRALAAHSHAARADGDAPADWLLELVLEPPARIGTRTVTAFAARLLDPSGHPVWKATGAAEDDGLPAAEGLAGAVARNLVDRLTQDGWAHPRQDPADPAPAPPRLSPPGAGGGRPTA